MAVIRADLSEDLTKYIDSLIDDEIILNRADSLRAIVYEHRKEHKQMQTIRDGVN